MQYYSLNRKAPEVSFREAVIAGQAPDKGLYFPLEVPRLDTVFYKHLKDYSREEIGYRVLAPYVGDAIPAADLKQIIRETISFDFPLVKVEEAAFALELFHGPTLAFKDVGARFMSRCLGYFNRDNHGNITVLVATSGDTGGAVANGFLDVEGVEVIILYPSGKVSPVQEKQLTANGRNITALEIQGTFDDCQAMVKEAFLDMDLREKYTLTSANSINIARWLPQQLYYFYALQQWEEAEPPVISVPSGNYGNIGAGILACQSGLPVKHFIAASNANDTIPRYFETGKLVPQPTITTISNAMDVSLPSNFIRIRQLFGNDDAEMSNLISAIKISDEKTRKSIRELFLLHGYIADPHGAVAYTALKKYQHAHRGKGIFLETAHPVKFPDTVNQITGVEVMVPERLHALMAAPKISTVMPAQFQALKTWMMERK